MFFEKVSDKTIQKFVNNYHVGVTKIVRSGHHIYVLGNTEAMGPQPEFFLEDWSAHMSSYYSSNNERIAKGWRKCLYQTFGEEYKTALTEHLEKQKKDTLSALD